MSPTAYISQHDPSDQANSMGDHERGVKIEVEVEADAAAAIVHAQTHS